MLTAVQNGGAGGVSRRSNLAVPMKASPAGFVVDDMATILFLHGWHSVPGGVKPTYLKAHGHEVINPALDDDDFDAALVTAQAESDKHQPQLIVESSRGCDESRLARLR